MLTALLLLPVLAILIWLYWYVLPDRSWRLCDSLILSLLLACTAGFVIGIDQVNFDDAGPLWPYIVSATGAYGILTLGLGSALAWRWRRFRSNSRESACKTKTPQS
jgi:hypothetical protein